MDTKRLQVQRRRQRGRTERSRPSRRRGEETMGRSPKVGSNGLERRGYGLGPRSRTPSLRRDSITIRPPIGFRLCTRQGMPLSPPSPLHTNIMQTTQKLSKKARYGLDENYSYLAGNAFSRDKKGRVTKDDSTMSTEMAAAGQGAEYTPYVCYEFEMN
jgi:hypothetical protein